jgi:hypothetical protein
MNSWEFRFCDERYLGDPGIRNHFESPTRNVTLLDQTKDVTHFDRSGDRIVNRGVDVAEVEKVRGSPVARMTVNDAPDARSAQVHGNGIAAYRPKFNAPAAPPKFEPRDQTPAASGPPPAIPQQGVAQQTVAPQADPRDAYYQKLQAEMDQRHQQELNQPPPGESPDQTKARQQREQQNLDEQRKASAAPQKHSPVVVRKGPEKG